MFNTNGKMNEKTVMLSSGVSMTFIYTVNSMKFLYDMKLGNQFEHLYEETRINMIHYKN